MSTQEARKVLGLNQTDVCLKEGLESLKECELQLYKRTLDKEEQRRIKLLVEAIDVLLEAEDYYKEER